MKNKKKRKEKRERKHNTTTTTNENVTFVTGEFVARDKVLHFVNFLPFKRDKMTIDLDANQVLLERGTLLPMVGRRWRRRRWGRRWLDIVHAQNQNATIRICTTFRSGVCVHTMDEIGYCRDMRSITLLPLSRAYHPTHHHPSLPIATRWLGGTHSLNLVPYSLHICFRKRIRNCFK